MPIYDFECKTCGHVFEDMTNPSDTPLCVKCFSTDVRRMVSTPNIHVEKSVFDEVPNRLPDGPIVSGKYYRSK